MNYNLDQDIINTEWIVEKAKRNDYYAQNIYAALCNMQWQKLELLPILKEEFWTCSWRHAGRIVSEIVGQGNYMDWYCSGMIHSSYDEEINRKQIQKGYVPEGNVTEEIREDFQKIGWVPVPYNTD